MFPYTIKTLCNSTELIEICNKLGHGISRSALEELATEHAFKIMEQQQVNNLVMPLGMNEGALTIAVHDNIDRLEETFSGKFNITTLQN